MPKKPAVSKIASQGRRPGSLQVAILLGSASDYPLIEETEKVLRELGLSYKTTVASAHRTPARVKEFVASALHQGASVFIAAAGGAAALPGVVAAETHKPVIGVPVTSALNGLDSLLSIAQMPGGIPVATVAIGKAGAKNAALLAAEILAISDSSIEKSLIQYREKQSQNVIDDAKKLESHT